MLAETSSALAPGQAMDTSILFSSVGGQKRVVRLRSATTPSARMSAIRRLAAFG
jgi:hypothetical protein